MPARKPSTTKRASKKTTPTRSSGRPKTASPLPAPDRPETALDTKGKNSFHIVGLGASAGGLEALEQFFSHMPPDSGMAFVVVPHLSPERKSIMAELLKRHTRMEVFQAEEGMRVARDCVYVIPPNKDMSLENNTLHLQEPAVSHGIRHPIDFFFRSLAEDREELAVCVILSGTGSEGALGLRAVKGADGLVLAQDVTTAKYDGMPSNAIATGLVDYILPPDKMPELLLRYTKSAFARAFKPPVKPEGMPAEALQKIFAMIRARTGHDFSQYKQNTIVRRIEKRMVLHEMDTLNSYSAYLRNNDLEVEALTNELLIRVTSFFRDPQAYDLLRQKAFPRILKNKKPGSAVRIWVPGCSTGEEAYSLAMTALESMRDVNENFKVKIFATDIDRSAIEIARAASYPASITVDVPPERLERYFIAHGPRYQVRDEIRDLVTFAIQDLIKDPPFSKLDMISCRNLLIYLGSALQKKVLPLFHYSLNPDGLLFLGSSETVGDAYDLFSVVDKRWNIFTARKIAADRAAAVDLRLPLRPPGQAGPELSPAGAKPANVELGLQMEKLLIEKYAPPCCVVNDKGNILYFQGRTGRFLEPAPGKAALNILDMAREGLRTELRTAIRKALKLKKDVSYSGLAVKGDRGRKAVNLEVRYLKKPEHLQGLLLVAFNEQAVPKGTKTARAKARGSAKSDEHLAAMDHELRSTKERLQSAIEELETSNEELKSLNEELQSSNEELQSTNEELETSREELQSMNEELNTVNVELQNKIEELSQANDDIQNLLTGTQIATIFLDNELRIKRYTPAISDVINLIASDAGRPISDIASKLAYPGLVRDAEETLRTLAAKEQAVQHQDGRWYLARVLPYRTVDNVIDGVVITFVDITGQRRMQALEDALVYAEGIVDAVREPLVVLDDGLRVISANKAFYRMFAAAPGQTERKLIYELGDRQWDLPAFRKLLEDVLTKNEPFQDYEVEVEVPGRGRKKVLLNARRIYQQDAGTRMILLAMEAGR